MAESEFLSPPWRRVLAGSLLLNPVFRQLLLRPHDGQEQRWKAGQFMNIMADAPFCEAAFNARLASKMVESGYAIRRTDRDFELASVSRELIEKFHKRTKMIEQIAREKYAVIEARARALARSTGMAFADAFAQTKASSGVK
jgi:conjugative relaxase-like TrwC/TraI family protein